MFYDNIAFELFHTRPTIEYKFIPSFNIKKSTKRLAALEEGGEKIAELDRDEVEYGRFLSYAYFKFKGGDRWPYLTIGYNYELEKGKPKNKNTALKCSLFAEMNGKNIEYDYVDKAIKLDLSEERTFSVILELVQKLLSRIINNTDNSMLNGQKKAIKELSEKCSK